MANAFPATGSTKSMGRIRRGFVASGSHYATGGFTLRGTLGGYLGITSGAVSISSTFGGYYSPNSTDDSDKKLDI
jgi:hypothetical protein